MRKFTDYRDILKDDFERRKLKNSSYSLRAFARDIGLLPSRLSDVLNGKQGLSDEKAVSIAQKINLNEEEKDYFLNLVRSRHGRSRIARTFALRKLDEISGKPDVVLTEAQFSKISQWYYFALLELTSAFPNASQENEMAQYLNLETAVVSKALNTLKELQLLRVDENGKFIRTHFRVSTTNDVPSKAIQSFHVGIIDQAQKALQQVATPKRDFSSINIWLNENDLCEAKTELQQFRRDLLRRYQKNSEGRGLYALNLNLFPYKRGL
jgi:uncharacterized protein (TIGR02147 family)